MFSEMMAGVREEAVQFLFNVEIKQNTPEIPQTPPAQLSYSAPSEQGGVAVKAVQPLRQAAPAPLQKPKPGGQGSSFFKG